VTTSTATDAAADTSDSAGTAVPKSRGLRSLAGPVVIAVAIQSVGNLLFHGLAGRWLTAAEYGALGALLAATTALAVPLGALQAAAAGVVARHGAGRSTASGLLRSTAIWSAVGALVLLPLAPLLDHWWHLGSWALAALVLPYAAVSAVLATARGILLGTSATRPVAATYLASTAGRLVLGIALTPWLGVAGALLATVAGEAAALATGLVFTRRICLGTGPRVGLGARGLLRPAAAVTGLFLLSTVDLLLARHFLAPTESGSYVAAATLGKTVLALPAAVVAVMYPTLVKAWPEGDRWAALRRTLIGVSGSAWAVAAVALVAPGLLLHVLYGNTYDGAQLLVRALIAIAALTSTATVLTYAALARGSRAMWLSWAGAGLEVGLVALWHDSPMAIAGASAAAVVPTVLALLVFELPAWRSRRNALAVNASPMLHRAWPALEVRTGQ